MFVGAGLHGNDGYRAPENSTTPSTDQPARLLLRSRY